MWPSRQAMALPSRYVTLLSERPGRVLPDRQEARVRPSGLVAELLSLQAEVPSERQRGVPRQRP